MNAFNSIDFDFLSESEDPLYLVGGTVRDLLCGQKPADIDLVVKGEVGAVANKIAHKINGKIVDLGKDAFAVLRIASKKCIIDLSPMADSSIEADLRQRDFTINAMAYDLKKKKLVDCLNGQKDLKDKTIRMVSDDVFKKDPARLIRSYRMAAAFHFTISKKTKKAINEHKDLVSTVAGERTWAELVKLFSAPVASPVIRDMGDSGLLTSIFPELGSAMGCMQNQYHQFDVFEHSLRVFEQIELLLSENEKSLLNVAPLLYAANLSGDLYLLKYSALLHDIGKPATRTTGGDGSVRFPGHAARGADMATAINDRLKLSNRQHRITETIIRHHIRPLFLFLAHKKGKLGRRGTVRFFQHCGELTPAVITHAIADIRAKKEAMQNRDHQFIAFCDHLVSMYRDIICNKKAKAPLINGRDLINEVGLSPSPLFKRLLNRVEEQRLAGLLTTRRQALNWIEAYLKRCTKLDKYLSFL